MVAEFEARRANGSVADDAKRPGAVQRQRKKQPAPAQMRRTRGATSTLSAEEQKEIDKQLESEVQSALLLSTLFVMRPAACIFLLCSNATLPKRGEQSRHSQFGLYIAVCLLHGHHERQNALPSRSASLAATGSRGGRTRSAFTQCMRRSD